MSSFLLCSELLLLVFCLITDASAAATYYILSFSINEQEKLYRWILQQNENGLSITVSDIGSHIQREIEYGNEDALASPRSQYTTQNRQASVHIPNASNQQASPILFAQANLGLQPKNSIVFSNALSSPVRQSLQPYHLQQDCGTEYFADDIICTGSHEVNSAALNDSSVDMHSDSPVHGSY